MALMSYKCPNCGGGLVFDPDSQKFQCEYCLSEFTEEEMKRMEEVSASPAEEGEAVLEEERTAPQEGDSSQGPETGEAAVYTCPSCGAQIVTDATTAARRSLFLLSGSPPELRGTCLPVQLPLTGSPGWKAFRPVPGTEES